MHFRQLLKGVLIGTALFFPTHAFAAKPDPVHVKKVNVARVVIHVSKHGSAVRKTNKHSKVPAIAQGHAVKSTATGTYSQKGKAHAFQKLNKHTELATVTGKNTKHATDKGKQTKPIIMTKEKTDGSAATIYTKKSSKQVGSGEQAAHFLYTVDPIGKNKVRFGKEPNAQTSASTKQQSNATLAKPVSNNKENGPLKGLPDPLQFINSQSSTTIGQTSEDRGKTVKGTTCFPALLLNKGYYQVLSINRIYVSRLDDICNQWTNAPPLQPPIYSFFSKTA